MKKEKEIIFDSFHANIDLFHVLKEEGWAKAEEEIISKTNVRHASKICVMPYSLADLSLRIGLLLQESIHDLCTYNNSLDFPWID